MMNRVVITGMGAVSPIGNDIDEILKNVKSGYCGIDFITNFDTSDFKVKLAAEVKNLDILDYVDRRDRRRMDQVSIFALIAAIKAFEDSGIDPDKSDRDSMGVYVSTGIGGLKTIEDQHKRGMKSGFEKLSPFFIPMAISNLTASNISARLGLHGSCIAPVTACAGSNTAIGEAYRNIKHGYSKLILAGGSESSITPLGIGGFSSMKALSESEDKNRASIPFDKERDGFVMAEGSAILVLEELEHALARGAHIYGEVLGYGSTCDAEHITQPNEEGIFAAKAMEEAIREAGIEKSQIDYINAHGTSTPLNDKFETLAVKRVFGEDAQDIYMSSTKSMTGHMLAASGSMEAMITLLAMGDGIIPATINHRIEDPECDLNVVKNDYIEEDITYAISNSLGFGGHNVSLVLKKWED